MKDKIGFGAISRDRDPFSSYLEKWAEVFANNETSAGIYRGIEDGYLILSPHILVEHYPTGKEDKFGIRFFLSQASKMISVGMVSSVSDIREEKINSMLHNKRIIIPSRY